MFRKGLTFNYIILIFYSVAHAVEGGRESDLPSKKKNSGCATDYTYP